MLFHAVVRVQIHTLKIHNMLAVHIHAGIVQTAYANGASTNYMQEELKTQVRTKTCFIKKRGSLCS